MSNLEMFGDGDVRLLVTYMEQAAAKGRPSELATEDDWMVQASWDRVASRLGFARSDVWTGKRLPALTRWQRLIRWGRDELRFAHAGGMAMSMFWVGMVAVTGFTIIRSAQHPEFPYRKRGTSSLPAHTGPMVNVHTRGLPSVRAVNVPPVGGPAGSQLLNMPDGTVVLVAPGADFSFVPSMQGLPNGFAADVVAEVLIQRPKNAKQLMVRTPLAYANIYADGEYEVRSHEDEVLVTVVSGEASVIVGRELHQRGLHPQGGQSVLVRRGSDRPEWVSATRR